MRSIKAFLRKIIDELNKAGMEFSEQEKMMLSRSSCNQFETLINPANGLPMIGGLDVLGNTIGSNANSDHYQSHLLNYSNSPQSTNLSGFDSWKGY